MNERKRLLTKVHGLIVAFIVRYTDTCPKCGQKHDCAECDSGGICPAVKRGCLRLAEELMSSSKITIRPKRKRKKGEPSR